MNILIKSVKIIDPRSKYNNQKKDILIKNGKIQKISNNINTGAKKIIEEKNLYVSPGWFDLHVNFELSEKMSELMVSGEGVLQNFESNFMASFWGTDFTTGYAALKEFKLEWDNYEVHT